MTSPIRLGLLAAARIAAKAIVEPAHLIDGVELQALSSRSLAKAQIAAKQHHIPQAFGSYEELIACTDLDAIYIATPASEHRRWAIAALEAGKHVLIEKPLASNQADAALIAKAADAHPDLVAMEAFHWRYHPWAERLWEVIVSGRLGTITRIDARFDIEAGRIPDDDIRWELSLGGGSTMDLGCYPINWVRHVAAAAGIERTDLPTVLKARAHCPKHQVDAALKAELRFSNGLEATIESSMSAPKAATKLKIHGKIASLEVSNPLSPQRGTRLMIESNQGGPIEHFDCPTETTYFHQLVAFEAAIRNDEPFPTTIADGVANMAIIDRCYEAAGLEPRPAALP